MAEKEFNEYYDIIKEIIEHPEFQKRKTYAHHGKITVYDHCLSVSKLSYKIAKKLKKDYKAAAIGGLLHDFYYEPWQGKKIKQPFLKKHGFTHAREARNNSYRYFEIYMNEKIENIILRHMFPLNITPPKYSESWIVTLADKCVSLEVMLNPSFFLYLFGIKKR